jgi:hypothetical protein
MPTHSGSLVVWNVAIAKEDQRKQVSFVENAKIDQGNRIQQQWNEC